MKFTKASVTALEATGTRRYYDDCVLPGFRLVVSPTGAKTFVVRARRGSRKNRSEKTITIGAFGVLTVEQAREQARQVLARIRLGQDAVPSSDPPESRSVRELCEGFLEDQGGRLKPKTAYEYRRLIAREIVPALGSWDARSLDSLAVSRWHTGLGSSAPVVANNAIRLLRSVYRWSHDREILPDSVLPTKRVKLYPEKMKERFLSEHEIARLGAALRRAEEVGLPADPVRYRLAMRRIGKTAAEPPQAVPLRPASTHAVAVIRFLLLTGWRKSEALSLKWDAVDRDRRRVDLADSKTGRSVRHLGAAAVQLLDSLPRVEGSPWVFPGQDPSRHIVDVKHLWQAVRHEAELADVRLHDLRHTFASAALSAGCSIAEVAKLLGHRDMNSTQRYAHLADGVVQRAANEVAGEVARMIQTP